MLAAAAEVALLVLVELLGRKADERLIVLIGQESVLGNDELLEVWHSFAPAFAGTIGNVAPRAPDSPARKYENAAMHALIKRFRDAGVENIHVVVLSSFEEPAISDRDRQAYEQLFPGTDIIFSEDLYKDTPELALMYLDRFHYNASGTQVLTRAYLDRVLGDD